MIKVSKPLVSIITLNWNGTLHTREFLRSITKHNSYENIEVIVVDNASAEDPTLELLSTFPSARIIRNKKNLGFSAGNNVGILAGKG